MSQKRTYREWLAVVNQILVNKVGLFHSDLPDQCYTDWYADGVSPSAAASRAIKCAKEN